MTVVSDASPIINLAVIGRLALLRDCYGTVLIPEAVYGEITRVRDLPGAQAVEAASWIRSRNVPRDDPPEQRLASLLSKLDEGKAEAIALAVEVGADLLLIDERRGRQVAARIGLRRRGLIGVLIEAKDRGYVAAVHPLLEALRSEAGFWMSDALHDLALREAGERS